ncbi:MAG: CfrBI family restriction endonuclease [Cytophagaceae bacterium]|nr:CfrBI family restriction endonuclease [Cytophagaceae bacterium]
MKKQVSDCVPKIGSKLSNYQGKELIDRIGEEAVKEVVISVLCGENLRALTEGLTRRRLMISNAAMLSTFLTASSIFPDFIKKAPELIADELNNSKLSKDKRLYLTWLIGLTEKGIQNILRGNDNAELKRYLKELNVALKESTENTEIDFGKLTGTLKLQKQEISLDWQSILFLFVAIGAQTLTIRGSEKSIYGKLFEKFVLGSLLTILGFTKINPKQSSKSDKVFWMSQREDKRESDAKLLIKPGVGIRFDIGFIGSGNSEISLDKVSRFEREMTYGRILHFMNTLVIVDRIGEKSRIKTRKSNSRRHRSDEYELLGQRSSTDFSEKRL